jgi:hypothetical protein
MANDLETEHQCIIMRGWRPRHTYMFPCLRNNQGNVLTLSLGTNIESRRGDGVLGVEDFAKEALNVASYFTSLVDTRRQVKLKIVGWHYTRQERDEG